MNLESKLLMSLKKRAGRVVLRRELAGLGSPSQVSAAIRNLLAKGRLVRLGAGIYAKSSADSRGQTQSDTERDLLLREACDKLGIKLTQVTIQKESGKPVWWVDTGKRRISRQLGWGGMQVRFRHRPTLSAKLTSYVPKDVNKLPSQGIAAYVERLAKAHGIEYRRSGLDDFAEAVTRAAGDDVKLDLTGKLLVALKKKHLINGRQFARLLTNYRKELKGDGVRSVRGLQDPRISAQH
ncbi:hypothetical protein [Dyella flagellata]|uniref:Transcriptional regulator, AbiEi antitoxin, Type IV TA system n=1 Tax=Dyella flagellata TaxID=1867833 RepID=A0ABQ5X9L1_9GAMM|nr:hypothetical protein [Dyella flagellata]GLQ87283.1 hypothetical protein GCM10007898_08490 [Dyella flagellata]